MHELTNDIFFYIKQFTLAFCLKYLDTDAGETCVKIVNYV